MDPQALRITLGLLRQVAAAAGAQFFTMFDTPALRRVAAAISFGVVAESDEN